MTRCASCHDSRESRARSVVRRRPRSRRIAMTPVSYVIRPHVRACSPGAIDRVRRVCCHRDAVVRFVETLPVKLVLACVVGYALFACSVQETGTSADKGAMGSSVGDTGVFGSVAVTMEAQASASTVLAGENPGEVVDGWEVNYSNLLVAVGEFRAELITADGADHTIGDAKVQIVDLTGIPAEGLVLREYDRVELGVS